MQFHQEVEKFLSKDKCDGIIKVCEAKNETPETGWCFDKQVRIKFEDSDIHDLLQQELEQSDDPFINTYKMSNKFTYVRYNDGGKVATHKDEYNDERAKLTIL